MVFRSIVSQLAKPNENFSTARSRRTEGRGTLNKPSNSLVSAGMRNHIYNVSKMEHPLSVFDKLDQFKLFILDIGLSKHMAGIDNSAIRFSKYGYRKDSAITNIPLYLTSKKKSCSDPTPLSHCE